MSDTLILAPNYLPVNYLPLSTTDWQTAVKLYFLDKVNVLEWYDDWVIHSANFEMKVPLVIATKKGFNKKGAMRFSRQNLYIRDVFTCQYCNETHNGRYLTIDHVLPKAQGGVTSWENCVVACKSCNSRKGNNVWRPNKLPIKPSYWALANSVKATYSDKLHPTWNSYIGVVTP